MTPDQPTPRPLTEQERDVAVYVALVHRLTIAVSDTITPPGVKVVYEEVLARFNVMDDELSRTREALAVYRNFYQASKAVQPYLESGARVPDRLWAKWAAAELAIEQFLREHGEGGHE